MKPSLLNLFVITRRCLSDKRMPGLDLEHRNRAYATHPMSDDSPVAKLRIVRIAF